MNPKKNTILKWICGIFASLLVILAEGAAAPISTSPKTMNTATG
ncbi:MAG: hypothetical protein ACI4P4_17295 [Faecousia sp.]